MTSLARDRNDPTDPSDSSDASLKLTGRQQEVFDLVRRRIQTTGSPPTRAEIAAALGFKSANAAEEHLQALARKGAIELLGGTSRGIRLKSQALKALNQARQSLLPLPGIAQLTLPLVGRVAAGSPILAQEHIDTTVSVGATLFARTPDYLLRVRGMSMRDAGILDGDLLAVQRLADARGVRNGQIVVARLGDDVTVKRFMRKASGGGVDLLAENPEFHTIHVPEGTVDFSLEGLAVGLIRNPVSM
ncbi:MAG: transcriptional repressor LexA [Rubrivivax sp.]|jgi:repressor LexA|nr:transcriptional repressor LexA [Rubrivivax sp.]